ncbi:MAG: TonB-dependent receptor plug domain-containing protein, partial [Sediminibacterium sp.]
MKKICLLALLCLYYNLSHGQTILKGQVQAATTNNPIPEALIYLSKARKQTISKTDGSFEISTVIYPDTLIISITGYTTQRIVVNNSSYLNIILQPNSTNLVDVEVQTGYQSVSVERATGSFAKINNELLNRKVGATILERLDGIASGLIFNRNRTPNANESAIQIRGRSTILANTQPLIVVDNFPYEGDINQINPNDIESITLLKDAAASSIWGVRAGNGVIVITTKKGRVSAAPRIQFNTNLTYGEKPNLYYQPQATGASIIEMESALFARGFYNGRIGQRFPGLSPAVVIFNDRRNNLISAADSATQIQRLAGVDNRSELTDYFYRTTIAQQYALNISGGGERIQYYFSAGWDDSRFAQLGSSQNRVSLRNRTQIHVIPNKLSFSSDLNFTTSTTSNPSSAYLNNFSIYQSLVGANGAALPVYRDYTKAWLDTIGQGQLLPWHNKPYDDIL